MSELVIRGMVAAMVDGETSEPAPGKVWIRDDRIEAVTGTGTTVPGFAQATKLDVGKSYVLPDTRVATIGFGMTWTLIAP